MGSVAGFKAFVEDLAGEIWLGEKMAEQICLWLYCVRGRSGDKMNTLNTVVFAAQMERFRSP